MSSLVVGNALEKTKPISLKALPLLAFRNIYLTKKCIVFVLFDMSDKKLSEKE